MAEPYYYKCELMGRTGKRGKRDPVVDGDTVDVLTDLGWGVFMSMRLRFAGINTPESRTRNLGENPRPRSEGISCRDAGKGRQYRISEPRAR